MFILRYVTVMGRGLFASTMMLQELHNFIAFRNKTFLFVKIESWNFVRFHEIQNHKDAFYFNKQKSFVPKCNEIMQFL